jgi:hypothetical protein
MAGFLILGIMVGKDGLAVIFNLEEEIGRKS